MRQRGHIASAPPPLRTDTTHNIAHARRAEGANHNLVHHTGSAYKHHSRNLTTRALACTSHDASKPYPCSGATLSIEACGVASAPHNEDISAQRASTLGTPRYCPFEYLQLGYAITRSICPAYNRAYSSGAHSQGLYTRRVSYRLTRASMHVHYQASRVYVHRPRISVRKLIQNG